MSIMAKQPSDRTRPRSRARQPVLEALEARLTMSSAVSLRTALPAAIHARQAQIQPIAGTIQGEVINDRTGAGFRRIQVDLIDSTGKVVKKTLTNAQGQYSFNVPQNGLYVVREVVPRGFAQTAPNFASSAPVGSFLPGFGNSSWNYVSTNTDPTQGPVGPAGWANIAPEGNDGFGAPINITTPAINLGKVLKVNYSPTVPKDIINNSHQIQVQFPSTATSNTVTAGGQVFTLTQFHYHDPAENTVHGRAARLEEHFVNVSASGAETVVAVFLQLGAHNYALDPVLKAASTGLTSPNSTTTTTAAIDFAGLLPKNQMGWFYEGSLTTPPLSQPVNWFVYATPITLDAKQLAQYEAVASGSGFLPNARPGQPLDGRQLNEIDYDVTFQNTSLTDLNFGLASTKPVRA
jgi:carbonic anhydrase